MEATLETLEPLKRLSKDLRDASKLIGRVEARYLVDLYYSYQDFRIQSAHQIRQQVGEPSGLLQWVNEQVEMIEKTINTALGTFAYEYRIGRWLQDCICGIGPVISAGLIADLDIRKAPSAGHFWSFAGLTNREWKKGETRPYNARLKQLIAFKAGESFVKQQSRESDFYGKLYVRRKSEEWERNIAGEYTGEAARSLEDKRWGADTNAKKWYTGCVDPAWAQICLDAGDGWPLKLPPSAVGEPGTFTAMLPPAHIHARARRWTVKLFVSHLHSAMYQDFYGRMPPQPYVIEHLGHVDMIEPPHWPIEGGKGLAELYATEP